MKDWTLHHNPDAQHVVPNDDLIVHVHTKQCLCAPRTIRIGYESCTEAGHFLAIREQVVHEAMDGRE